MKDNKIQYYNNIFLDQMRLTGDPSADQVIEELFAKGQARAIGEIMRHLDSNKAVQTSDLPQSVRKYFEENAQLPEWADQKKMKQGLIFFQTYTTQILSMLGYLSLPYCYAAADGAQVLYLSQRLRQDISKRLTETLQFVLDVMAPQAFDKNGAGFASVLKVRLMHAAVRFHVLKSNQWDMKWGLPINQEDMGGTNGAFSWLSVRGLRKMGYLLDARETEAFFHLWNVIGYLMGVRTELLPDTGKEAFWLDKKISERHFRKSEAGVYLTKSLLDFFREQASSNLPQSFSENYMRFLVGDKVADILEIPQANWTSSLLKTLKLANSLRDSIPGLVRSGEGIPAPIKEALQNEEVYFSIPLSLN